MATPAISAAETTHSPRLTKRLARIAPSGRATEQRASSIAGDVADDLANGQVPGRPIRTRGDTPVAVYSYDRRRTTGIGPDQLDDGWGQALRCKGGLSSAAKTVRSPPPFR